MFSTKNDFDPQGLHYTPVLPHPNLAVIDAIRELMREMGAAYARIHLGLCGWSDWEPSSLLVHALLILDTPISAGYFECLTDSAHSECTRRCRGWSAGLCHPAPKNALDTALHPSHRWFVLSAGRICTGVFVRALDGHRPHNPLCHPHRLRPLLLLF